MSHPRTAHRLRLLAVCAAICALFASACSSSATITAAEPTSFDQAAAQNEASQSGAAQTDSAANDGAPVDAAALDDLSDEEAALVLQAFDEVFVARDIPVDADPDDDDFPAATLPAGGGPINHSATVPYGLCDPGWVVFDLLTWDDAVAMLGLDPAARTGLAAQTTYQLDFGSDEDAGGWLLNDWLQCGAGDIGDSYNLTMRMTPYSDGAFLNPESIADRFEGDIQILTSRAGQPMVVKVTDNGGPADKVEVLLHWDWDNSRDRGTDLVLSLSNFTNGITDEQIAGLIEVAEVISAGTTFTPPAFDPPLPNWFSCGGRNFVHSDAAEIAEVAEVPGPFEVIRFVDGDWESTQCGLGEPGGQDLAPGAFRVIAEAFPPGSENYEDMIEALGTELGAIEGSTTVAGRPMVTYSSDFVAIVILDDGVDRVAITVYPNNGADADTTLAKAIEIAEIITR